MRSVQVLFVAVMLVLALGRKVDATGDKIKCSCAVFGEKGDDKIAGEPLLTKSINFEAKCNADAALDCGRLCNAIAKAGAAQDSQYLCQAVGTTSKPIRPTIYSKICDEKVWTYADLTASKDYCCVEGKHISCPTASE